MSGSRKHTVPNVENVNTCFKIYEHVLYTYLHMYELKKKKLAKLGDIILTFFVRIGDQISCRANRNIRWCEIHSSAFVLMGGN